MPTATETTNPNLCDIEQVKPGDKWSRQSYGKVVSKDHRGLTIKNEHGMEWSLTTDIFEKEFRVHDQFVDQEEKTVTELGEICNEHPRMVMTICFNKQVEANAIADTIMEKIEGGDIQSSDNQRKWRKMLREIMADNERVLVGYHNCTKDTGGRYFFTDMEAPKGNNVRRVDPRTIRWMVVDGKKYTAKKK